jgi:uncharacterized protein
MRIELANLKDSKEFVQAYAADELVLQDERLRLVGPPEIAGEIRRDTPAVKVDGRLTAVLQVECDRCLKFFEFPVNTTFKVQYVTPDNEPAQTAVELTEEDLDLAVFDGEGLDIDELVAEELLLAVPAHVLCKDDCKGLCPVCGVDLNMVDCGCEKDDLDPRWAGLKKLVNGKS